MEKMFISSQNILRHGFIIPLSMVLLTIIMTIVVGISTVIIRQTTFSKLNRESRSAYLAADNGLACATFIDDAYVNTSVGIGIFPYSQSYNPNPKDYVNETLTSVNAIRGARGIPTLTLSDVKCASSIIFETPSDIVYSDYTYQGFSGKTSVFTLRMQQADGTDRCAKVTVNKTDNFRQIISQGYSNCIPSSQYRMERAVISTSDQL